MKQLKHKKQRIVMAVTNDLVTDQRVHKVASSLTDMGFDLTLVGRKLKHSSDVNRPYRTHRFRLFFNRKAWFYAEYNLRLFWFLLSTKVDVIVSNDLDTLLPCYLVSKLRQKTLVYDSHEYFTEVPELLERPQIRRIWLAIEQYIFPKLTHVITVNESIANLYYERYGIKPKVVRNIAPAQTNTAIDQTLLQKITQGNKKMLIIQGSGINIDRGAEEAVEAMQWVNGAVLYIIGSGDVFPKLRQMVENLNLTERVKIINRLPYHELLEYTKCAFLGLSLDKGSNPNYEFSLPNKIFDYIQSGVPLLVSPRKEVAQLVNQFQVGWVLDTVEAQHIAEKINHIIESETSYQQIQSNLKTASKALNWESESGVIKQIYSVFLTK